MSVSKNKLTKEGKKEALRRGEIENYFKKIAEVMPNVIEGKPVMINGAPVTIDFSDDKFYKAFIGSLIGGVKAVEINESKGRAFVESDEFLDSMSKYMKTEDVSNAKNKIAGMIEKCFSDPKSGGDKFELCSYSSGSGKIRTSQQDIVSFYTQRNGDHIEVGYLVDRSNGKKHTLKPKMLLYETDLQ